MPLKQRSRSQDLLRHNTKVAMRTALKPAALPGPATSQDTLDILSDIEPSEPEQKPKRRREGPPAELILEDYTESLLAREVYTESQPPNTSRTMLHMSGEK